MKIKNKHVYATPQRIREIAEEEQWIGRHRYRVVDPEHIIIYALPERKKTKKEKRKEIEERKRSRRGNGYRRN